MEQITPYSGQQLPDNLEDLTQFVLVGKAKLQAYMLKLQTVNRLSTAQEIRGQTLKEAQEISTALIAAEQRIGELLLLMPKQSGGDRRSDNFKNPDGGKFEKTKSEAIKEMGYGKNEAADYQQMAKNPEVVQKVIDDAIASGEIVTKASVMREIKSYKDRIKTLQEQKPEVKTVEVPPADYEEIKKKAEMVDVHKSDFQRMQKAYEEMAEKWKRSELEKQKLIDEANKPEEERKEGIKRGALMFCSGIARFIEEYGGYVWLAQHINEMGPGERKSYLSAINAVESWVNAIKGNMEGIE